MVLDERVDQPPGLGAGGVDGVLRRLVLVGDRRRRRQLVDEVVVEARQPKYDVLESLKKINNVQLPQPSQRGSATGT